MGYIGLENSTGVLYRLEIVQALFEELTTTA
jgi:hypothetical protein